jgi:regulator of vacuolar morphogenesis
MEDIITIRDTEIVDGVTYYQVHVELPLRSFSINRRYNEFEQMVSQLATNLGVGVGDLPYQLPAKRWFRRTGETIDERKRELAKFLNSLVKDPEFLNSAVLKRFLEVPPNVTFDKHQFSGGASRVLSVKPESIDESSWMEVYRTLKLQIGEALASQDKVIVRSKVSTLLQPGIENLQVSLTRMSQKISKQELERRQVLLKDALKAIETLLHNNVDQQTFKRTSKRVFGNVKESEDTISLTNKELLQQQVEIHKNQDREVEQLRHLIAKQRQIGQMINDEVEEQNAMLDDFQEQMDVTTNKLNSARQRAKKLYQ